MTDYDLYPGSRPSPVLVFVHGGAWRSEDKADHAHLAHRLVAATNCTVAVPNYRLTPPDNTDPALRHPIHAQDILAFLTAFHAAHPTADLVLIGHSCSTHILASIVLDSATPVLAPAPTLLAAIKALVCSEGIYDLDTLVARFPTYRDWFVAPAFGPPPYAAFNATRFVPRAGAAAVQWLLLHSPGDTLIDEAQAAAMHAHLAALDPQAVQVDYTSLHEEHNDVLKGETYVALVKAFVARVCPPDSEA